MRRSLRSLIALCGAGLGLIAALPVAEAGQESPNDPVFEAGLQWGLQRIGAPAAWNVGTGEGVTIAVVDSGVDLAHEDLAPQLEGDISCVGSGGSAAACSGSGQDDNGHGTHVAGIAVAATDNGRGVAGVAPGARLLAVRVLEHTCERSDPCTATGSADDVAAGIRWAADRGADVINLSLGGGTLEVASSCAFCDAVEYAWSKGAIPVVAAGNDAALPESFSDEHAVVVTATTRGDTRGTYSQASTTGLVGAARWPVSAPGGEAEGDLDDCSTGGTPKGIVSTYWAEGQQNGYACLAGTSMAAPHVSAALAVLRGTGLSPQASIERLVQTAQDLGAPGRDGEFGIGRIDLGRAVGAAPGGQSTTSSVPGTTTTDSMVAAGGEGSSIITAPAVTTTIAPPPVSLPPVAVPAPFDTAAPPVDGDQLPGGLVGLATAAVLASGAASVAAARRLAHASRAPAGTAAATAYGGAPPAPPPLP